MSIPSPSYETPQASPPPPAPPAPQGAPLQYEFKSVQALRGTVSRTKARWQDQGWEFVSENQGTLRTELTFRRVKPKTFGVHLLSVAATFRRLPSKTQSVSVASLALIVVIGIVGVMVGTQGGGDSPSPSAGQTPASTASPAEPTSGTSELDASRSSGLADDQSPSAGQTPASTASPAEPTSGTSELDASRSSGLADDQVLTADNSEKFAAVLAVSDYCDERVASFATEYGGRTIEFDGSIASLANHGDYDTRYDILIAPGDMGPESTVGPAFKFEDVNVFDLNLTGAETSDSVGEGDRFRFVAQVVEYNPNQCLLFLEPVSTGVS